VINKTSTPKKTIMAISKKILLLSFLLATTLYANAGEMLSDSVVTKTTSAGPKKSFYLPILSFAQGLMNFNGDVGYNKFNQPFTARSAFQIELQFQTAHRLSFALFLLSGRVFGDEKTVLRTANFKSTIVSEGFMLRYDFISNKNDDQILVPFLTAGVEYMFFRSKTDLLDANGRKYQYWDDGSIRDIAQTDPNSDQAVLLHRDYNYETDLRDANLDNLGKYRTTAFGLPVGAGVRFQVTPRFSMHFSSVCHFAGTDMIDGISEDGKGSRKGNSKNDKFIFTSASLRFSLSSPKESEKSTQITALVYEDSDGDGVTDLDDDSSGTPRNNPVTASGKPYDLDNDGIPDYRDKELKSASNAIVNENGVTLTEAMIEEQFRRDSLSALPAVIEYLKAYDKFVKRNPEAEKALNSVPKNNSSPAPIIPDLYKNIDMDRNGIISPKEISQAIDAYLARQSPYDVSEFFDLIDYFFSQR
jgi:hypothetical protein